MAVIAGEVKVGGGGGYKRAHCRCMVAHTAKPKKWSRNAACLMQWVRGNVGVVVLVGVVKSVCSGGWVSGYGGLQMQTRASVHAHTAKKQKNMLRSYCCLLVLLLLLLSS